MARIRILVPTFRRSHLLPRALESLRAQTFTDWVCEVRNDAPDDPAPRHIVTALGDPRIRCIDHPENLGLTRVFNLLFAPGPEPYGALLEDDNWWKPGLLEALHSLLENRPDAELAWANMEYWQEHADGSWSPTGSTIWPVPPVPGVREFGWPSTRQVLGHFHSNGAALVRLHRRDRHQLPEDTVPGSTEAIRERSFASPLLLLETPLAHFALTRQTARPKSSNRQFIQSILLAASFFRHEELSPAFRAETWNVSRQKPARTIHTLLLAAWVARRPAWMFSAQWRDWLWFSAWLVRHPGHAWSGLHARSEAPALWNYLDRETSARFQTARSLPRPSTETCLPSVATSSLETSPPASGANPPRVATIRVFLLTYRRPALLPRALASLRAQTHTDWICELHNDDPDDDFPRRLVAELADPRITLHHHAVNWGPVAAFNHAFAGGPEPYLSLLEDDNWWEPDFLATALAELQARPGVTVAWANMRLWREEEDGSWSDTGRAIWTVPKSAAPTSRLFRWPQPLQCFDALHSQGAMLVRAEASRAARMPADLPLAAIEPARERLLAGDWLLLPQVLANFALTRSTARETGRAPWMRAQLLVAGSYLENVPLDPRQMAALWKELREQTPPATALLFHLAFAGIHPFAILRHARLREWILFLAGAARSPVTLARSLRFRAFHPESWQALNAGARARSAASVGGTADMEPAIWRKTLFR